MNCKVLTALASCFVLGLLTASARAEDVGSVEIVKADARLVQKLVQDPGSTVPRAFVQTVTPPEGQLFLVVWLDLKLTMGKDEDDDDLVRIEEQSIGLVGPDKNLQTSLGRCTRDGRFFTYSGDFSHYGKPERETVPWDLVFVVPAKGRTFELKLGAASQALKVTEAVLPTIPRTAHATFQVKRAAIVDTLPGKMRLGNLEGPQGEATTQIESLTSRYAVVQLIIKPKASNFDDNFQFNSFDIGLLFGTQVYVPPVGYIAYDEFTPYGNTYTSEQDAAGDFAALEATIIYPLPGKVSKFKVLYLLEPVAEGAISK